MAIWTPIEPFIAVQLLKLASKLKSVHHAVNANQVGLFGTVLFAPGQSGCGPSCGC